MMEANFRDPKLFSKLVNKNRTKADGYTSLINVDGKVYKGDAQVLSGFFLYHNGNSEPLLLIVVKRTQTIYIQQ